MRVEVDDATPTATLTMEMPEQGSLAYVTMSAEQLRPLIASLVQALTQLDNEAADEGTVIRLGPGETVSPIYRPVWHTVRLGTGDPAILVELWDKLWVGFTLSIAGARRLATSLLVATEAGGEPGREP